jgi:hypothetical protein
VGERVEREGGRGIEREGYKYSYPHTLTMHTRTVEWHPLAYNLLGSDSIGYSARTFTSQGAAPQHVSQVTVKEGAVILVRDARQRLPPPSKPTAPERGISIARGGAPPPPQLSAAPPPPPATPGRGPPPPPPPPPPV